MYYYFLSILLVGGILATAIITNRNLLARYKPDVQFGIIFMILTIPVTLLLFKLDSDFQPLPRTSLIIKGVLIGLAILVADAIIYLFIKQVVKKKLP